MVSGPLCKAASALKTHSLLGIQALSTQGHHPYFSLRVREFPSIFTSDCQWLHSHGLSYTTFQYSGITVSEPSIRENDIAVTVKFNVRNTGNTAGSEIAQLYISWPSHSTLTHPPLTLKAFSKISLEAGESGAVELRLDKYAVSSWIESSDRWAVERGNYTISVGPSSQELPLTATLTIVSGFEWTGL